MASGSSRPRIDQYFASKKKRKSLSPALESKKSGNEPKITTDGSPSAKGSLEKLLVISEDNNMSSQAASDSPARRVSIKRNLTLEISSNSKIDETRIQLPTNRHSQGLNRFQEANTVKSGTEDEVNLAASDSPARRVPIKRNLTLEISSNSKIDETRLQLPTNGHSQGPNRFQEVNRVKSGTKDEINLAVGNKDISETTLPEKPENFELKKFATSFLSLYCSELPSSMPSELSLDGKRGHSRLSTGDLDSRPVKRQHTNSDGRQCIIENAITCHGDNQTEPTDSSSITKSKDAFLKQREVTLSDMDTEPQMRLRKCGTVSSCCVAAGCDTPGSLSSKVRPTETPKSMRGSSIFSPGETFWNQAIQVADGLVASNNLAPHDPGNLQTGDKIRNLTSLGYEESGQKPGNVLIRGTDKSSSLGLISDVGGALNQREGLVEEVSPFPVKHLDFSLEGNNLMEETQARLQNKSHPIHRSQEVQHASINHEKIEAVRFPRDEYTNNDLLKVQKMSLECAVGAKEGKSLTEDRDSATSDKLGDKLKDTTSSSVSNHNDTPSSFTTSEDRLELNHWLPPQICSTYKKRGISKLYQWQVDCLQVDGVLHNRNLVYCASTSAGKSFVAEILMLRRVLSIGKMALLVLPYVSICAEKAEHLELLLEPLNRQVRSYYGNQGGGSLPKDTSIAVCTIEKANSLINKLLEEGRLSELGIIVIDELHMVGDQNRGYLLELMLTKLRYAAGEGSESSSGESSDASSSKSDPVHGLQIVGMSATMPNVAAVAQWLQAALFETDFRPVPLEEYIKVGYTIYNKEMHIVRTIPKAADLGGKDPDHIVELCNEVVQEGHSVLIFCSSRKGCESTARHVANYLRQLSTIVDRGQGILKDISFAIDALRRSPAGLDPVLEETLPAGVAYHHAGLTVEERETIETCYRKGLVRVLTATSTLAAGVNLPARRVIFRQPRIGRDFIDGTRYKQMAGRAGRTGIDTKGESILICKQDEVKRITRLLTDSCTPLHSCLAEDKNGMTHAILEVVAGGIVQTANDIHRYVRCTLLNSTQSFEHVVKSAQESLRWLCRKRFLEWNEDTKLYNTTPLGRASFGSSLNPEESLIVLDDLNRAREGFVLASDLHLVYIVTPTNVEVEPDWELFYQRFMELSALDQSVGNLVGVQEPFLMRMAHGAPLYTSHKRKEINSRGFQGNSVHASDMTNKSMLSEEQKLRVSRRFYVSLILSRLVQEAPVAEVCDAFKVARGMVQSLQENAGRFASMVTVFCERLGWHDLEGLVAKFQNRVSFGVRAEIVELTTIPYIKGSRARALYKAGLRTPQAIAEASVSEIAKALFESSSWASQGSVQRRMQLGVAKKIKNGARKIVLDKAEEARMAAFSAFKSLGIEVPPLSRPLLSTAAAAVPLNATTSSGDNSTTSIPVLEDRKKVDRKISELVVETPKNVLSKTSLNVVDMPEEANSAAADQNESVCKKIVDGKCSSSHFSQVNMCYGLTDYGNGVSDSKPEQVRLHEGERKDPSNGSKEKAFEKGPLTTSSFPGGLDSLLDMLDHTQEFYFDLHFNKTSELNKPTTSELHGIAICWENSPVYYINVPKDLFCSNSRKTEIMSSNSSACTGNASTPQNMDLAKSRWERVGSIMGRKDIRKFTWNLKVQTQVLKRPAVSIHRSGSLSVSVKSMGLDLINDSYFVLTPVLMHNAVDVSIVVWMLWPDEERSSNPNLEKVVKKRLSSEAAAAAAKSGRWKNQMRRAAHNGCCRRVAQTRSLTSVLWKLIIAEELTEALLNIENPLVHVLADMEFHGIGVDMESCLSARNVLARKLKSLEKEAYKLAGMKFSLYNAADIANILYEHLKLPLPEGLNKGKYHPSTDKHCLDLLRNEHPIIPVIKEHRTLGKLLNCTLGSICSLSKLSMRTQRYTLHGRWLQTSTATGRLSMEEPNLQCVEHLVEFKMHTSGEHVDNSVADSYKVNARDFFLPTQDNMILVTADYSQIELRMMAHFSRDSSLIELLSKPHGDVFTMIAAKWTGKAESTISAQERDNTKRLIYGILYGMGATSLSEQLGCSKDVAAERIHSFKRSFPGVASWLQEVVSTCLEKGYVKTLKGRKRFLAKIKSGNSKEKSKAQRQAVNSICQGSAADIIKIAMINIHSVIVESADKCEFISPLAKKFHMLEGRCRILLQVHDELIMEADSSVLKEAALLLKTCMESAASLLVPLQVKLKVGRTWGSLEPLLVERSEDSAVELVAE